MVALDTPVQFVKGIGPQIAKTLNEKRIATVEDLLFHLPFRYEDRLHPRSLTELVPGEMASVIAEVRGTTLLRTRRMPIFEMTVGQNLSSMKCMWFHGTYLEGKFKAGQMVALYGKVEPSRSTRNFKMIQPQFEILPEDLDDESRLLEVGRITPVYESLSGSRLASRWIRKVIYSLLEELRGRIPETMPAAMLERLKLASREEALRFVHFPPAGTPMTHLQASSTGAHRRLIFEELFYLECGLELKRRKLKERAGITFETSDKVREALRQILPFHPTAAQKRSLGEIVGDMRQPSPMRRLLQGDVGSGKTIVALQAMLVAIENGYQAALMAPTEILATQHSLAIRKLLERSSRKYRTVLLTGSLDEEQKRLARRRIFLGEADLVIGTHALIEEKVDFAKLGLVVVDEQHRFGVLQRFRLMKKPNAAEPDVLVMTATPIPRTLALSIYGDLDLSVLDELPPGRTPIVTKQVPDERADEVWKLLRDQVKRGHQAYIVYPVIEGAKDDQPELDFAPPEAEEPVKKPAKKSAKNKTAAKSTSLFQKPSLKSATEMYEELRATHLSGLRLGLLHGRLDADEKEIIMRRFQRGDLDVLISTTVIEVGVDVPNASLMVIEHAERFGLAQLHQLRGRVGRGAAKSYCILMTGGRPSPQAEERLAAMVRTQNGFELAELDLEQRGPGEFFGTRQAGLPDFRVANIVRDRELLELAKEQAARFVEKPDAEASEEEKRAVWDRLRAAWQRRYGLVEAG
ncbi:ATP-dependent DNA helicase RecG [Silvibacterium bohemicum]|uniref:ATP-dependent DNA helicase RecG n=1 Tax=Silvibacterium bohemicum TaxID=1577686 RepID=A0A841JWD7_9BACT|nr:ATP-dependent DNA helicase RecG [Silvibacterium bohemicum]MBB6142758.1 ATP-dependent DNA helicase RecG [Silvibacterium bohemicum]